MKSVVLLLLATISCARAWALDSGLGLQQMNHRSWTVANGNLGEVHAITQTVDGILWVGTSFGLFRFDGERFVRYSGPAERPFDSNNISALRATPDGALWIGFRFGGVSLLEANQLTRYDDSDGVPSGTVSDILIEPDGSVLVAARAGLARLRGARWEPIAIDGSDGSSVYAALFDRAGSLWVMTVEGAFVRARSEAHFRMVARMPYQSRGPDEPLAEAPDGAVWASQLGGLVRLTEAAQPTARPVVPVFGALLFDHAGNLWIGGDSLRSLPASAVRQGVSGEIPRESLNVFATTKGLAGAFVDAIFEDREENIWVGTTTGLERFSRPNLARLSWPPDLSSIEGAASRKEETRADLSRSLDEPGSLIPVADLGGSLWVGYSAAIEPGYILKIRDGRAITALKSPTRLTSSYPDPDGSVWFGGPGGIVHVVGEDLTLTPLPERAQRSEVQSMVRDSDGALWVSIIRRGVFRLSHGQWEEVTALQRGDTAVVLASDTRGDIWFGYPRNRLSRQRHGSFKHFTHEDGLAVGTVTAIFSRGTHLWIGGERGLARFDGSRFLEVHTTSHAVLSGISGIVETATGDLWLQGISGVIHIPHGEVARLIDDPTHLVSYEQFDSLDGLPGPPVQLRPTPNVLQGPDGLLWFNTVGGLAAIDPSHIHRNPLPPPVRIWSLNARGVEYEVGATPIHLPTHTTGLQIEYTAGSLTIPERVQFRYKLADADREWQDAGGRREAFYTNLGPGHYRFQVIASNNDGVWNNTGASLEFLIAPAFYQTKWFYAFCVALAVVILAAAHRVRVRYLLHQARARLQERLVERERLARELHDTLLQGAQGLLLRFQAVANRIPPRESTRELMDRALERAEQVLTESRRRVRNLRVDDLADLPEALARAANQVAPGHPAQFRVNIEGVTRELHPIVREEVFMIAREALANAFKHARANNIEAEIAYGNSDLVLRIRDDGVGIDPEVLKSGRPEHWGLLGMRERAQKVGARLDIWGGAAAGTEVELRVPAQVAYRLDSVTRRHWWPRKAAALDVEDASL